MRSGSSGNVGPRSFTLTANENGAVRGPYPSLRNPVLLANRTLSQAKTTIAASPDLHAFFHSQRMNQSFLAMPATNSFSGIRVHDGGDCAHFCPTSKMSHDLRRRGSCSITIWILLFHFEQTYDSTRRDGEGRWLWRLVGRLGARCHTSRAWTYAFLAQNLTSTAGQSLSG